MSDKRGQSKEPAPTVPISHADMDRQLKAHQEFMLSRIEELTGIPAVPTVEQFEATNNVVVLNQDDLKTLAGWFHFPTQTKQNLFLAARKASTMILRTGDQPIITFTVSPNDKERLRSRCPDRDDPEKFARWMQVKMDRAMKGICDGSI